MTEAMPFLQKTILLSYDPWPSGGGFLLCAYFCCNLRLHILKPVLPF